MPAQGLQGTMLTPGPFGQGCGPSDLLLVAVTAFPMEAKIQVVSTYLVSALTPPQRWRGSRDSCSPLLIRAERLQMDRQEAITLTRVVPGTPWPQLPCHLRSSLWTMS